MAEYSLGFSESLLAAASALLPRRTESADTRRTILYLSLLASEICLKALLEKAGMPVLRIARLQHRLENLLKEIDKCEHLADVGLEEKLWIPATSVRALTIYVDGGMSSVGKFLDVESAGASKFPNEVRYGMRVVHFPPEAAYEAASRLLAWAKDNWEVFRLAKGGAAYDGSPRGDSPV